MNYSVRAMQHMLDMAINTKIPYDLAHKQPFVCFRNWLQCLERLWFNFKICGIFAQLSVVFWRPFWYFEGCRIVFYFIPKKPLLKTVQLKVSAENYRSENVNCRSKYNCDHQSNQIKPRKFYEYFSGYANFSKFPHKGHKTKGHIL